MFSVVNICTVLKVSLESLLYIVTYKCLMRVAKLYVECELELSLENNLWRRRKNKTKLTRSLLGQGPGEWLQNISRRETHIS